MWQFYYTASCILIDEKMKASALLFIAALLASCTPSRMNEGRMLAQESGWNWANLHTEIFDLAAATHPAQTGDVLTVYLEGDGFAYARPNQPALDPTPTDPVALRMALLDPTSQPVAWIGRPCQYTMPEHGRSCRVDYWTGARYAPEVVASIGAAIDIIKLQADAKQIVLIGYSGGGALAVLLAAQRADVKAVVTVAANIDLVYWTRQNRLAPLAGSLDPAKAASSLGNMPQIHFTGGRDTTVGTDVIRSFMTHLPPHTPVQLIEIPDYTHDCCWAQDWRKLITAVGR